MRRQLLIPLLLLTPGASVHAQEAPAADAKPDATPEEETPSIPATTQTEVDLRLREAPVRPRLVFLGVHAPGLPEDAREALEALITRELGDLGLSEVVGPAELRGLIELTAYQQMVGCADDACSARISEAVRAQQLVTASVRAVGGRWALAMQRYDSVNQRALGRAVGESEAAPAALLREARRRVPELFGVAGLVELWNLPPRAEAFLDDGVEPLDPTRPLRVLRAGAHRVEVRAPGFTTWRGEVEVVPGARARLRARNRAIPELEAEAEARRVWGLSATLTGVVLGATAAGLYALAVDNDHRLDALDLRTTPQADLDAVTSRTLGYVVAAAGVGTLAAASLGVGVWWLVDNPAQRALDAE